MTSNRAARDIGPSTSQNMPRPPNSLEARHAKLVGCAHRFYPVRGARPACDPGTVVSVTVIASLPSYADQVQAAMERAAARLRAAWASAESSRGRNRPAHIHQTRFVHGTLTSYGI